MNIFDEVLNDINEGTLCVGDNESRENTWAVSLTSEQAEATSAADVVNFIESARSAFSKTAPSHARFAQLRFYAWVDEQAGQLRFSVSSKDPLPFGVPTRPVEDPLVIPNRLLSSDYLEGIPWSEFEYTGSDGEPDNTPEDAALQEPLEVYVVPLFDQ